MSPNIGRLLPFCFKTICSILLSFAIHSALYAQEHKPIKQVDVGVLAPRGNYHAMITWQPTMDWLESQIPGVQFTLHSYLIDELDQDFKDNHLDFILTNPGQSVQLARKYPLSWLATFRTAHLGGTSQATGSVMVVRKDSPIKDLYDAGQSEIVATNPQDFEGFLAMRYEIEKLGYSAPLYFKEIRYQGFPIAKLVFAVRDKEAEATILPACLLEEMDKEGVIDINDYRVLNPRFIEGYGCQLTSTLYPNWTLAKTSRADNNLSKQVTTALLAIPNEHKALQISQGIGWTSPVSHLSVDLMYQNLDIHPLQTNWTEQLKKIFFANFILANIALILLFGLNFYLLKVQFQFFKNKKKLQATNLALQEKQKLLEHAQRLMIINELGTSVAHELNQPLAAIKNYAYGAQFRIKQGIESSKLLPIMDHIEQQVTSASAIVQRLRGLIKKQAQDKQLIDPNRVIKDAIELIEYDYQAHGITIDYQVQGKPKAVQLDVIGMQQVIINLLQNAKDACLERSLEVGSGKVSILLEYKRKFWTMTVTDNGVGLNSSIEQAQEPFFTTKPTGLGLGLAICRELVDSHQGKFILSPLEPHGCQAIVTIPNNQGRK